jgi:hypothetical protein
VYSRGSQPTLAWNPSAEDWGPVSYTVSLNGAAVAQTSATSLTFANGLTDGTYSWNVNATNTVNDTSVSGTGKVVVDTFAPRLRLLLTGLPRIKATQHLRLAYVDPPNPTEPGSTASGVKSVTVSWGDGSKSLTGAELTRLTHAYAQAGLYRVTVTVTDRVANTTQLTRMIRVLP